MSPGLWDRCRCNRFADVRRLNFLGAGEIGDGSRDL